MIIHSLTKRGSSHKDYCEDYEYQYVSDRNYLIAAVFDGCSSGTESYFASTLFARVLRKTCQNLQYPPEVVELELTAKHILQHFTKELLNAINIVGLDTVEVLTTMILLVLHKESRNCHIIAIGDGVIVANGKVTVIDQHNEPDYLAYYIADITEPEEFDNWYEKHTNRYSFEAITDISISTDGVLTFINPTAKDSTNHEIELNSLEYLLKDTFLITNHAMLKRKCNILKTKHNLDHYDDLGIIRVLFGS